MVKINILYLTVAAVIAINSLALAEDSDDFLSEGRSGRMKAAQVEKILENPDKTFTVDGRTYKILNESIQPNLLREMADYGESISGKVQQTMGPNGIGWQFYYDIPRTSFKGDEWTLHPNFVGNKIEFQIEDITPQPPAWYEFWK